MFDGRAGYPDIALAGTYPGTIDPEFLAFCHDKAAAMLTWLAVMCHPDGDIGIFNDAAFGIEPTPGAHWPIKGGGWDCRFRWSRAVRDGLWMSRAESPRGGRWRYRSRVGSGLVWCRRPTGDGCKKRPTEND